MKLTLRTLLAWLDDTLSPREVRRIGDQVAETPYAQQLIGRIRKVTRQRRLTVPPSSGPDAVDPNIVARYLDNELSAEEVSAYEKRCLDSDVHLAEAASCHQILSLIKNKAKVPPEARYRLYRLIKGREAVRTNYDGRMPAYGHEESEIRPPWALTESPKPSKLERFGPPVLAFVLMAVLIGVGWHSLRTATEMKAASELALNDLEDDRRAARDAVPDRQPARVNSDSEGVASPRPPDESAVAEDGIEADAADPTTDRAAQPKDEADTIATDQDQASVPEGAVGVVSEAPGVLLLFDPQAESWERLAAEDTLSAGDRLVNLMPFRSRLTLGDAELVLVGQGELIVEAVREDQTARFELVDGNVVVRTDRADPVIDVGFVGRRLRIGPTPGRSIGLSWYGERAPGEPFGHPILWVSNTEGMLTITDEDGESEEIEGPGELLFRPDRGFLSRESASAPAWVTDPEPTPAERRAGEDFLDFFESSDGPLTFRFLEGLRDERATVRSLSAAALEATDQLDLAMPHLNDPNDPELRQAVMSAVLRRISRGPEVSQETRQLVREYVEGEENASALLWMLLGFPGQEIQQPDFFERLVGLLDASNPSVRQLAITTLRQLTGRDSLGYDPDEPDGPGRERWENLLGSGELHLILPPNQPPF